MHFPDPAPEMESFFPTCSQDWNGLFFSALIFEKIVSSRQKNACLAQRRHVVFPCYFIFYYFPSPFPILFLRKPELRVKPSFTVPYYAVASLNTFVNKDAFKRRFHLRGFSTAALMIPIIWRITALTSTKCFRRSFSL